MGVRRHFECWSNSVSYLFYFCVKTPEGFIMVCTSRTYSSLTARKSGCKSVRQLVTPCLQPGSREIDTGGHLVLSFLYIPGL